MPQSVSLKTLTLFSAHLIWTRICKRGSNTLFVRNVIKPCEKRGDVEGIYGACMTQLVSQWSIISVLRRTSCHDENLSNYRSGYVQSILEDPRIKIIIQKLYKCVPASFHSKKILSKNIWKRFTFTILRFFFNQIF